MRVQVRLRTLILLVAVTALLAGALANRVTSWRRDQYRQREDSFAYGEADIIEQIAAKIAEARRAESQTRADTLLDEAERLAQTASWHVKMERRYAWAVDHPWEPLPPSTPKPATNPSHERRH